jgi:pyruvate,orthophosphate dikinase
VRLLVKGQGASPGRVTGPLAVSAESARAFAKDGAPAVLVRNEASAEDADAIRVAAALVTTRGGITGDGAIIARALGKPCLTSCGEAFVRMGERCMVVGELTVHEGERVTVDGAAGPLVVE